MNNTVTVTIDSVDFQKWIDEAPEKVNAVLQTVIDRAAFLLEQQAKNIAPHDTGRLKQNILTEPPGTLHAEVISHVNYSRYVHDGTKYMKARPYMTNAKRQIEPMIPGMIQEELKRQLN